MKKYIFGTLIMLMSSFIMLFAQDEEPGFDWPREIETKKGSVITLYQPQLETFENNNLIGRMAISVKVPDKDLIFGAIWFEAKLLTDLDTRIAVLDEINITQTHFPDVENDKVEYFARMLEDEIEGWDVEMSLDRLLASLELAEVYQEQSAKLNNQPPEIYFRTNPATLVYIDGDPILMDTEESGIKYVANTPYFLVKYEKDGNYYLKGAKWWYSSSQATSGWDEAKKVPSKIKKLAEKSIDDEGVEQDSVLMAMAEAPELIISTLPAELISTDRDPKYTPIEGTTLLYVDNSENDIIMDINTQNHYILLAGRWYFSRTLKDGDWTFSDPADLPKEFSDIPVESPMSNVRTSVPGTEEANMAVLEQTIPQTATVDRATASVEVSFDGEPQFEEIEGTSMSYAVNCDKSVLLVDGKYYCVDDGIWFESANAKGPYTASIERPEGVEDIPAESPVYNVKYVYIYDYTPEVIYVGYTPGYTCSYVYGGVVVYGTGYYYKPWYGYYYYPRPVTYGFGVHYNPYTGWGFSFSVSFGRHYGGYGMWGPRGYHHGYRRGYSHGYRHGYNRGYAHGARRGYAAGKSSSNRNVYSNRSNGVKSTGVNQRQARQNQPTASQGNVNRQNQNRAQQQPANAGRGTSQDRSRASTQKNNVYTDRSGNVQRQNSNGNWENRSNGQWQQQQSGSNRSRQNTQQMNREAQSRQQGSQRQSNYNSSRSTQTRSSGASRSGGGASRGGGGRRR